MSQFPEFMMKGGRGSCPMQRRRRTVTTLGREHVIGGVLAAAPSVRPCPARGNKFSEGWRVVVRKSLQSRVRAISTARAQLSHRPWPQGRPARSQRRATDLLLPAPRPLLALAPLGRGVSLDPGAVCGVLCVCVELLVHTRPRQWRHTRAATQETLPSAGPGVLHLPPRVRGRGHHVVTREG